MWDNILLALQSLRANKLRALLTMLGIIIGIGAVIAIKTVGSSLSASIADSMSGFGVSNISLSLTQKSSSDENTAGGVQIRRFMDSAPADSDLITEEMLAEYRAAFPEQVAAIELTETVGAATAPHADGSGDTAGVTITGVNGGYLETEGVRLLCGRSIRDTDGGRRVCVVSDRFVTDCLGIAPADAVGQTVRFTISGTPQTFYILGVYEYDEEDTGLEMVSFGGGNEVITGCYIPLEAARALTGSSTAGYRSLTVVAAAGVDTTAFLAKTQAFFETFYTRNDSWTVEASSMESLISGMTEMLDTVSLGISAIAAISLLVGGIGVMNIMLVSITERTREIGTRKALGAPRRAIRLQFVVEAVVICLAGGAIGILAGIGLGAAACSLLGYAARPEGSTILLAVVFSAGIGVFFGYYPADKAAKLDPIEALRYE